MMPVIMHVQYTGEENIKRGKMEIVRKGMRETVCRKEPKEPLERHRGNEAERKWGDSQKQGRNQ